MSLCLQMAPLQAHLLKRKNAPDHLLLLFLDAFQTAMLLVSFHDSAFAKYSTESIQDHQDTFSATVDG